MTGILYSNPGVIYMIALVLFVIVGLLFALFATHNTSLVTVSFGQFVSYSIPLYVGLLFAFILGLAFSSLFYLLKSVTTNFQLRKNRMERKVTKNEIADLTKQIHKLELENERLKTQNGTDGRDTNSI